ncbi:hypothetical protein DL96DRAFT_1614303 [Flagelloscypha sp. PMI_526]|nr:hypothetical protein DL96DRAFT_1614303 [Flagelloscypha sp. PMI_526]
MDFLKAAVKTLNKLDGAANKVKVIRKVAQTKSFPPLPVDVVRTICEFAASLDHNTARNLSMSSKDIREWVAPVYFRGVTIRNHQTLIRLKTSPVLERIGPHVRNLSLQPDFGDNAVAGPAQMEADFSSFLNALPNLVHFHWPVLAHRSMWGQVPISLPSHVCSLEIGSYCFDPPTDFASAYSATNARTQVTHIYSELSDPPTPSLFIAWTALTHIFFDIRPQYQLGNSIATSTFPLSSPFHPLPRTIVSCILMDAQSSAWDFNWAINQALVDLVLGDTDPRIVFCAGEDRGRWMEVGGPGIRVGIPPTVDLSWIRKGLKNAVLYHNRWSHNFEAVWIEAEEVRIRRKEPGVRAAVYKLLKPGP